VATQPPKPRRKRIWFDIETTGIGNVGKGFHFANSSIIELSYGGEKGAIQDLAASPFLDSSSELSHWSRQKAWEPLVKKGMPILTEKEILSRFIKFLDMNTGAELIGWNVGYTAKAPTLQENMRGFDVPGLMARATKYGMHDQMKAAIGGVKIRDVGQEFLARFMNRYSGNKLRLNQLAADPRHPLSAKLLESSIGYMKQMTIAKGLYGARSIQDIAKYMSTSGVRVVGWSQENTLRLFRTMEAGKKGFEWGDNLLAAELQKQWNQDLKPGQMHRRLSRIKALDVIRGSGAHQAEYDVAIARLLTDKIDTLESRITNKNQEEVLRNWAALAERQKAINSISYGGFTGDKLKEILEGEWYKRLPTEASLSEARAKWNSRPENKGKAFPPDVDPTITTKEAFLRDLGEAAEAKYGKEQLPKDYANWTEVVKDLKQGEKLASKYTLHESRLVAEFFDSKAVKAVGKAAAAAGTKAAGVIGRTFGQTAEETLKEVGEGIGKGARSLRSRGGVVGMTALAVGAMGPLGALGTDADEYKEQMSGHWKHVLLGKDLEANKIPGSDHLYNTVRGLPHSGIAHFNRSAVTDFGSGWIPANGNALILSDPEHTLEGNFEAMRRVQEAIADNKISNQEYNSFLRAMAYQRDVRLASYYTEDSSYLDRAANFLNRAPPVLEPNEIFGVRVDPTVMDFRREVLQNADKRAAFREDLAAKQRADLENKGRFERNELFNIDLSNYKEVALEASNMRAVNLENFAIEVEDADTLLLHRKNFFGSTFGTGDPIGIRLAGIDAPETGGHDDVISEEGLRLNQEQPYGQQAKQDLIELFRNSENHQLLVSAEPTTYGRHTGVVFGEMGGAEFDDINSWGDFGLSEQVNFNMELLRRGSVASLPFGSSQQDMISRVAAAKAEEVAADTEEGMWQYTRYKASRHMSQLLKNSITFNTFTQRHKLAANLDLAAYASYLHSAGRMKRDLTRADTDLLKNLGGSLRRHGYGGRKRPSYMKGYNKFGRTFGTFTPPAATDYGETQVFTKKIPYTRPWVKADDNFHNTLEAFRHEGQAYAGRRRTDFGSGWDGNKSSQKLHPMEDSPNTGATASPSVSPKASPAHSVDSIIRSTAAKDRSVHNARTREGISTTINELRSQVQDKKSPISKLALEMKRFSWDSDPSRGSKKQEIVDNIEIPNSIKEVNVVGDTQNLAAHAAKFKRKDRFNRAHASAVVRRSLNSIDPGRRSRKGSGAHKLVV